jgi:hypothetical protein
MHAVPTSYGTVFQSTGAQSVRGSSISLYRTGGIERGLSLGKHWLKERGNRISLCCEAISTLERM